MQLEEPKKCNNFAFRLATMFKVLRKESTHTGAAGMEKDVRERGKTCTPLAVNGLSAEKSFNKKKDAKDSGLLNTTEESKEL